MNREDFWKHVSMIMWFTWFITLGVLYASHCQLEEARQTVDKQERQLKELYGQVNELTLQYVEIVKRINNHGVAKK